MTDCPESKLTEEGWWCICDGHTEGFQQIDFSKPYRSHDWKDPGTSEASVCRKCGARSYGTAAYLTCTGKPL